LIEWPQQKVSRWRRSFDAPSTSTSTIDPIPKRRWQQRSAQSPAQLLRLVMRGLVADLLVDTDIFIDHLRGAKEFRPKRHRVHYSVVTRAELFAGNSATDLCSRLLAPFREVDIDRAIAERAGRIARESGTRLPDALIAATALERGLSVVTRNRKHFEPIRGIRLRAID
jgi:toxin FitB